MNNETTITVGDLRRAIEGLPDDADVSFVAVEGPCTEDQATEQAMNWQEFMDEDEVFWEPGVWMDVAFVVPLDEWLVGEGESCLHLLGWKRRG